MASRDLLLHVCTWLRHEGNRDHWLLVAVLICGDCQWSLRGWVTLGTLPAGEEEAPSSQRAFCGVPVQAGSTKTCSFQQSCLGGTSGVLSGQPDTHQHPLWGRQGGAVPFFCQEQLCTRWQSGSLPRRGSSASAGNLWGSLLLG